MDDPLSETSLVEKIQAARDRDWVVTAQLAAELRARFPHREIGYELGAAATRTLGRLAEAGAILDKAATQFGDPPWLILQQALTAQARGDPEEARRFAAALRGQWPQHPAGYQLGADSACETRRLAEAEAIAAEARERFPKEGWPLLLEAKNHAARGETEAALDLATRARAIRPDEGGGYALAAKWLRDSDRFDEAEAVLREAEPRFSGAPWFVQKRAEIARVAANRRAAARLARALAADGAELCASPGEVAVIVGMHRAGTSLCAKVVDRLGFPLGGPLLEAGPDNPDGYQEHKEVNEIHEALLERLNAAWDTSWSVRADFDVDLLDGEGRALVARLEAIVVAELRAHGGRWAFKDPRAAVFLPLWKRLFARLGVKPIWILAARDPRSVAASLFARNRLPPEIGELLWSEHYLNTLRHLGPQIGAVVHYDRWFAQPRIEVERLARSLGVDPDVSAAAALDAIDAGLQHNPPGPESARLRLSRDVHAWLGAPEIPLENLQRRAQAVWRRLQDLACTVEADLSGPFSAAQGSVGGAGALEGRRPATEGAI